VKGYIVKSAHVTTSCRPMTGLVASVRVYSMVGAQHLAVPASFQLDRNEDSMHPGEGSA